MTGPVRSAYDRLIADHELKPDPAQENAVAALDRLAAVFKRKSPLEALFGSRGDEPAGVYLWGGVGRLWEKVGARIDDNGYFLRLSNSTLQDGESTQSVPTPGTPSNPAP